MLHSKFIFALLVLSGTVLAPFTGVNYLIQKNNCKDSEAKTFTVASQDSGEAPIAKI